MVADTIFALSTAPGRAGIAVVRVSGPKALEALKTLSPGLVLEPRQIKRARFYQPGGREELDDGMTVWFPRPHSFTGEDVTELFLHGGLAVVGGVLSALGGLKGLRPAEPGEFTRRAFDNGKLDLTEVEGLADLIDAETEAQRVQALGQMGGHLGRTAERLRSQVLTCQALVEAAIDFSDEGDVAASAFMEARARARTLLGELDGILADGNRGEILRDGFRVAIAGPPNAGKSSLINRLAGRDAVIVSAEAGTTRDVVELHLNLGGLRVAVADTAGVREGGGEIEKEGIKRGLAWARAAHLVVWLEDGGEEKEARGLPPEELQGGDCEILNVISKADLIGSEQALRQYEGRILVSSRSGEGIDRLVGAITAAALRRTGNGASALITRPRHRLAFEIARAEVSSFLEDPPEMEELAAERLRRAGHALARLAGRIDVEDVLGEIFAQFCIGK